MDQILKLSTHLLLASENSSTHSVETIGVDSSRKRICIKKHKV